MGKSGSGDPSFTSTSRAGAPWYSAGKEGSDPARAGREVSGTPEGIPRIRDLGLRTPGNRGAPARGVDVKPPSRRGPGSRIRGPGDPRIPRSGSGHAQGPAPGLGA